MNEEISASGKNLYSIILTTALLTIFFTGCTTSHIRRELSENPLPKMAQFAQANDYKVDWNGSDHLLVKKNVNWGMLLLLRRDKFSGDLNYKDGILDANMCLEMREFLWYALGIPPATMELKPQFMGCAVTPSPRRCANEIFQAAGLPPEWP
jgi:hypothetical protein